MRPKTLLLLIAAIPLVGYGLAYGAAWWQVRSTLQRFATAVAPVAEFRYGGIRIGPSGTIAVRGLIFAPRGIEGAIRVDRVEVKTPGIDFILHGSTALQEGKIPRRLGLAFTGLRIPTEGPLWERISRSARPDRRLPDNGLGCGIGAIVRMEGPLKVLTPSPLVIDLEVLMETGALPGSASVQVQWRQHGFITLGANLHFRNAGGVLANLATAATLAEVSATAVLAPSYLREAFEVCALHSHVRTERFLPALLTQNERAYLQDIGLIPGPGLRDVLAGLLAGAEVRVRIAVPEGFDLTTVGKYRPEDVPRLLDLKLALGGVPVGDLSFTTTPPAEPVTPTTARAASATARGASPAASGPPAVLGPADLQQCVGCVVLLRLRDGHLRRGTLEGVTGGSLSLRQDRQEGTVIVHIPTDEIIEARRLGVREAR